MEIVNTVGIDLSKSVFQICAKNHVGRVLWNKKISRDNLLPTLSNLAKGTRMFMEACQSAHYWSQEIQKLGLIPNKLHHNSTHA